MGWTQRSIKVYEKFITKIKRIWGMQNTVRCTTKEVELSVSHRQSFKTEMVRDMDIPPYIENKADVIVREDL